MDLLSLVGLATKKRGDYFQEGEKLAREVKTRENLEELMTERAKYLVKQLQSERIRFEEYERAVISNTFVSAMAAIFLASYKSETLESSWPTVVGKISEHLVNFLEDTKRSLNEGFLVTGGDPVDFEELPGEYGSEYTLPNLNLPSPKPVSGSLSSIVNSRPTVTQRLTTVPKRLPIKSWVNLASRLVRYLASPSYNFFQLGMFEVNKRSGVTQMRRKASLDDRTCHDCVYYDELGWQPIGSLPLPGNDCVCHDRCRCEMLYR
jgi:hypothetical protein